MVYKFYCITFALYEFFSENQSSNLCPKWHMKKFIIYKNICFILWNTKFLSAMNSKLRSHIFDFLLKNIVCYNKKVHALKNSKVHNLMRNLFNRQFHYEISRFTYFTDLIEVQEFITICQSIRISRFKDASIWIRCTFVKPQCA